MKKTIELIKKQDDVLVDVIRYLDSHGHSDTPVREAVDKILNFEKDLKVKSNIEIRNAPIVKERYINNLKRNNES